MAKARNTTWRDWTLLYRIINEIGSTREEIIKRDRHGRAAFQRQMVMYLMRQLSGLSFPKIGDMLERDHTTVINGFGIIQKRMKQSSAFRDVMVGHEFAVVRESKLSEFEEGPYIGCAA